MYASQPAHTRAAGASFLARLNTFLAIAITSIIHLWNPNALLGLPCSAQWRSAQSPSLLASIQLVLGDRKRSD